MARKTGIKNAIKSADFRPKLLLAQPENIRELLLGTLLGQARSVHYQSDPKDPSVMQEGLAGLFSFEPAEGIDGEELRASRLWIPDSVSGPVMDILKDAEERVDENGVVIPARKVSVDMAFHVYSIRSSAALGYTWKFVPVFEPKEADPQDPIAQIKARAAQLALPAPEATRESTEAETAAGGQPDHIEEKAPKGKGAKAA